MNMNGKYILSLIMLIFLLSAAGQSDADIIKQHYFNTPQYQRKFENRKVITELAHDKENTPFIANLFMEAVYLYKDYISPQDMDVCTFHPSCSEYAFLTLKYQSFPEAVLNTGDRLMRCYSSNYIYYPQDSIYHLSEDYPDTTR